MSLGIHIMQAVLAYHSRVAVAIQDRERLTESAIAHQALVERGCAGHEKNATPPGDEIAGR